MMPILPPILPAMRVCALILLATTLLAACGFKGPLYLPKPGSTPAQSSKAASRPAARPASVPVASAVTAVLPAAEPVSITPLRD
ncbi:lipoprotein [Andreprevotia sp. IGB-42]|uniref:LPS translocon maturation chaperone LptM n=1 Tax=Andreprevotia sp. IGB-42 TaxID=2497473 RepID=UPI0035B560D5